MCESKFVIIKKGKRAGTTQVAQSFSPFLVAVRFELENTTRHIANNTRIIGKIFRLKDKNKNFIKIHIPFPYLNVHIIKKELLPIKIKKKKNIL